MSEAGPAPYKYVVANFEGFEYWKAREIKYSSIDCINDPTPENFKQTYLHELYDYDLEFVRDTIALVNKNEKRLQGTGYSYYFSGLSQLPRESKTRSTYSRTIFKLYLKLGRPQALPISKPSEHLHEVSKDAWDTLTGMHTPASTIS
ncbi:hypothetical protein TWF970_007603 [Orbilia oligospora]|uniref:Uncharacterized protein n=1 Tax=Orbilia oligospora TaxID=2813651 RepID=A0A7C8RA70_ORBOL|nr:hypothetical protein TWF970_007603 [Orbilia oligospora]